MATLVLRTTKGLELTHQELDDNFTNLNSELAGKQASGTYASGTGSASGVNTGDQTDISGNAGTATALSVGADRTKLDGIAAGATANTGDMVLASAQSVTGAKTFNTSALLMKGSSTGVTTFASANASATGYTITFPAATGTLLLSGGALGTPSSGVATNLTGVATQLTAGYARGLTATDGNAAVEVGSIPPTVGQVLTATSGIAATWQAAAAGSLAKATRSTNTILGAADKGDLIHASASYTQTITAAATLGSGWWCLLRVDMGFATTLDANVAELIDGQATAVLQAGQTYLLACAGTAFTLDRLGFGGYTQVLTSGTSWTCPGGVRTIKVTCLGGGGGGGGGHATANSVSSAGAGGSAAVRTYNVVPGTTYTYAIGAAGTAGVVGVNGGNGGTSSFGSGGPEARGGGGGLAASASNGVGVRVAISSRITNQDCDQYFAGQSPSYTGDIIFSIKGGAPGIVLGSVSLYGLGGDSNSAINTAGTAGVAGAIMIEY